MKKILFLMLAAVLFAACSKDDEEKPGNNNQTIDFADFSTTVGMSYANMLKTYGDPSMNFGSFYVFDETGKENVESIICIVNPATQSVYSITENLKENAYTAEQINAYFASKYNDYGEEELDYDDEDFDDEDVAAGEVTKTHLYGNAKKMEEATLVIAVFGNTQVTYTNPALAPEEPEGPDMSNLNPRSAVAIFMGAAWEDLQDEYGDALLKIGDGEYLVSVDNEWLMAIGFTVEEGKVVKVVLLYNEDLTDEDIIEYYKEFGYTAMPYEGDEESEGGYLFMNMATMDMFTYSDGRAEFVDLSNLDDEEDEDEYEED